MIARIHIGERAGGNRVGEGGLFVNGVIVNRLGGRRVIDVDHAQDERIRDAELGLAVICRSHANLEAAHEVERGLALEAACCRVEIEPVGQRTAVGQGCSVAQDIGRIGVAERVGRERVVEGGIFHGDHVGDRVGDDRLGIHARHAQLEDVEGAGGGAVRGRKLDADRADIGDARRSTEGERLGIEMQPGRQRHSIFKRGAVGEAIVQIDIVEGSGGDREGEGLASQRGLVRDRGHHGRGIVHVLDRQREGGRGGELAVAGRHLDGQCPNVAVGRRAAEGACRRIETEPARQHRAVGLCGGVRQCVPIDVNEGIGRNLIRIRCILADGLAWNAGSDRRRVVDVDHCQREVAGDRCILGVSCPHTDRVGADIGIAWGAGELPSGGVEVQPGGQVGFVFHDLAVNDLSGDQLGGVGQRIAMLLVDVGERVLAELIAPGRAVLSNRLIGKVSRSSGGVVDVYNGEREVSVRGRAVVRVASGDTHGQDRHIIVAGHAGEGVRGRVEVQPRRQDTAIGQRGAVAQGVERRQVGVGERIGCERILPLVITLLGFLIHQRILQRGRIVDVGHCQRKVLRHRLELLVGRRHTDLQRLVGGGDVAGASACR